MAEDIALVIEQLNKDFRLPHNRQNSLKDWALHFHKPTYEKLHALRNIDFNVKKGEFFGIVGRNGSGKSTLLKIIGGIYAPTKGRVIVNGTLTPFIELGIGFNPELTGRENVYLNGAILGLTRKEVVKKYQEIVDFAELEKFMDQKLKNYSSGMQVRLAFSIAMQAHNDILLIDEVLAVGDANFQRKCFNVFKDMKRTGKTVVFVTHDMGAVQEYCDRAMLLESGKIEEIGRTDKVANKYTELNYEKHDKEDPKPREYRQTLKRKAIITKVFTSKSGEQTERFKIGEPITITLKVLIRQTILSPVAGITVKDLTGKPMFAINTKVKKIILPNYKRDDVITMDFNFDNSLNDGTYIIEPAIASTDVTEIYDTIVDGYRFNVTGSDLPYGVIHPEVKINYKKG